MALMKDSDRRIAFLEAERAAHQAQIDALTLVADEHIVASNARIDYDVYLHAMKGEHQARRLSALI